MISGGKDAAMIILGKSKGKRSEPDMMDDEMGYEDEDDEIRVKGPREESRIQVKPSQETSSQEGHEHIPLRQVRQRGAQSNSMLRQIHY